MKLYTRANFEAKFEPKNFKTTAVKMLSGVSFAAALYTLKGWEVYLIPLIVVLLYYAVKVIHVLIKRRP
ncbi:hypothetical protein E4L95_16195 [Paracoccus liaowanqingii]|uniref:Uncharacterized protein n=1 Tax=Paracoccus liaowanqingii TaxID=2560053 RepID=A0A4Z1CF50_9RHOB|nr:hypothetical protein [Paracoccus liaowanqingii]TGN52615.1 hypothetical protein E4L95_16195 [Paracoccus liaowanqingii]